MTRTKSRAWCPALVVFGEFWIRSAKPADGRKPSLDDKGQRCGVCNWLPATGQLEAGDAACDDPDDPGEKDKPPDEQDRKEATHEAHEQTPPEGPDLKAEVAIGRGILASRDIGVNQAGKGREREYKTDEVQDVDDLRWTEDSLNLGDDIICGGITLVRRAVSFSMQRRNL